MKIFFTFIAIIFLFAGFRYWSTHRSPITNGELIVDSIVKGKFYDPAGNLYTTKVVFQPSHYPKFKKYLTTTTQFISEENWLQNEKAWGVLDTISFHCDTSDHRYHFQAYQIRFNQLKFADTK